MSVQLDHEDDVATVTIDRPDRLNALDSATLLALGEAIEEANTAETHVLVLRGSGDAFCAGADVNELVALDPEGATDYVDRAHRVTTGLARFPAPTIAALDGYCLGGGWELALACDLRVATTSTVLGHTEIDLAVVPAWGGLRRLVRLTNDETARRLVFFGDRIDAQDAHELNLIGDVVAEDQLDDHVASLAADLAGKPGFALRATKEALASTWMARGDDLRYQRRLWGSLFGTDAQAAEMQAFLDSD